MVSNSLRATCYIYSCVLCTHCTYIYMYLWHKTPRLYSLTTKRTRVTGRTTAVVGRSLSTSGWSQSYDTAADRGSFQNSKKKRLYYLLLARFRRREFRYLDDDVTFSQDLAHFPWNVASCLVVAKTGCYLITKKCLSAAGRKLTTYDNNTVFLYGTLH